jgi:ribosomal protein S10
VKGKQHTITWHVDGLKSSHVDPEVNDEFYTWLQRTCYGSKELGHVTTRGPTHEYLAMKLDYSTPVVLKVDMTEYISSMLAKFPYKLQGEIHLPWKRKKFKVDKTSKKLDDKRQETFHSFLMKAMFLCKRARAQTCNQQFPFWRLAYKNRIKAIGRN